MTGMGGSWGFVSAILAAMWLMGHLQRASFINLIPSVCPMPTQTGHGHPAEHPTVGGPCSREPGDCWGQLLAAPVETWSGWTKGGRASGFSARPQASLWFSALRPLALAHPRACLLVKGCVITQRSWSRRTWHCRALVGAQVILRGMPGNESRTLPSWLLLLHPGNCCFQC